MFWGKFNFSSYGPIKICMALQSNIKKTILWIARQTLNTIWSMDGQAGKS